MPRISLSELIKERGGALAMITALLLVLVLLPVLLLTNGGPGPGPGQPTPRPTQPAPTATLPAPPPTPLPALNLNPQHGIHAPIGNQWTDPLRQALASFRDSQGVAGAPGLVLALSVDMIAANNTARARLEQDLFAYQSRGTEIYIRMYPQRFPGGFNEAITDGRNTVSGTPAEAARDIFNFVDGQQRRNGWHFTRIIPGNEPDLEWPNQLYASNLLPWQSNGDPLKYQVMNRFWSEVYRAWEQRVEQPEAAAYRDVELYFPPLAQDATPGPEYHAGFYYYEYRQNKLQPVGNRYDALREAVELYGRVAWHNYFQPGRGCLDIAAAAFPDWLKQGIEGGWPGVIGEAGWSPDKLALPSQNDSRAKIVRFWQLLGVRWEKKLYTDDRPQWQTTDQEIDGARFEADLARFTGGCHLGGLKPASKVGVAVWLAGSEGNFEPALGVEPGPAGRIRRWLQVYGGLAL